MNGSQTITAGFEPIIFKLNIVFELFTNYNPTPSYNYIPQSASPSPVLTINGNSYTASSEVYIQSNTNVISNFKRFFDVPAHYPNDHYYLSGITLNGQTVVGSYLNNINTYTFQMLSDSTFKIKYLGLPI